MAVADLLALAEDVLPTIAAEFLRARRPGNTVDRAALAGDLWTASVACFLQLGLQSRAPGHSLPFFDLRRPTFANNQFVGARMPAALTRNLFDHPLAAANGTVIAALFEQLKECRLQLPTRSGTPNLVRDRQHRRNSGSYYTPKPLRELIVRETVGAAWRAHLSGLTRTIRNPSSSQWIAGLAGFRLVDPACGGGDFLLSAVDFLVERMSEPLATMPDRSRRHALQEQLVDQGCLPSDFRSCDNECLLRSFVIANCLYGVDLDPLAVELTRARLWLELERPILATACLDAHLRHGNALLDNASQGLADQATLDWRQAFPEVFDGTLPHASVGFQAVIGNPPYGATREPNLRRALVRRWPQMQRNSDAVVGFIGRADDLCAPAGRIGFVVPKPLTYSCAWHALRDTLYERLDYAIDVSRAWPEVLLEQVLLGWRPTATGKGHFRGGEIIAGRIANRHRATHLQSRQQATILCALQPNERQILARLKLADRSVGEICKTFRGRPLQRELSEQGHLPVVGGRDLARWRVRSASGYLQEASALDLAPFQAEKLVFQNIIAHIMRPEPHIRLIGAWDSSGTVTLDTVNNLVARAPEVDLRAVLALLHSGIVNWFVYAVVYNKAIRTMHFDQYFLNKIPLPAGWDRVAVRLAKLSDAAGEASAIADAEAGEKVQSSIDRLVARAYGVPDFAANGCRYSTPRS